MPAPSRIERIRARIPCARFVACLLGAWAACTPPTLISTMPAPAGQPGSGNRRDADTDPERAPDAGSFAPGPGPGPTLPPSADGGAGNGGDAPGNVPASSVCPGGTGTAPASCAALGVVVAPEYAPYYTCFDLGPVPGLPMHKYGGLTLTRETCSNTLLIGGDANLAVGKLYTVKVRRDPGGHISAFEGTGTVFAEAPYNDGGVAYGPGGVLFLTRWPSNELQQTKPGSTLADKVIDLMALGVAHASASLGFVPSNLPGGGAFKLVSWSGGQWRTMDLVADGAGTYDVKAGPSTLTLPGGPEGFVYVAAGSPQFPKHSLLVSEWSDNAISTYEIDEAGDPKLNTRKDFITGLRGAEGAYRDPATGDFFFSTWGQTLDRVIVVRGFAPITID